MRVFFALPIQKALKLEIEHWRSKSMPPPIKIVPAANFHITLAFVGTISEGDLELLYQRTVETLNQNQFHASSLDLTETGYWAKPEILWIGPERWPENLTKLARKLHNVGRNFGGKKEKRAYRPHLTLSRKCKPPSYPTSKPHFTLHYEQIVLYSSTPIKNTVRYTEIQSWPLLPASANAGKSPATFKPGKS